MLTLEQKAALSANSNRKQLRRQFGLSFQAVECLLKLVNLRAYGKPRASQADVARALGIDRARVCLHLKRAESVGLLVRVGRAYFFRLNVLKDAATQADLARRAAHLKRAFVRKCRELGVKSGFVAHRATHTEQEYFEGTVARGDALQSLRDTYVPVHLRKSKA